MSDCLENPLEKSGRRRADISRSILARSFGAFLIVSSLQFGAPTAEAESYRTHLKESAKSRLGQSEQTIQRLETGQGTCWLGVTHTWDNKVTALTTVGADNGLKPGDWIVGLNEIDVAEGRKEVLIQHQAGDLLDATVKRGDKEVNLSVRCIDGAGRDKTYLEMYRAAAAGDWQGCIDRSKEIDVINEGATPLTANFRRRCSEAIRCSPFYCKEPRQESADLLFETMSLRLPAVVIANDLEDQEQYVIEAVQWLEKNRFHDQADALARQLAALNENEVGK